MLGSSLIKLSVVSLYMLLFPGVTKASGLETGTTVQSDFNQNEVRSLTVLPGKLMSIGTSAWFLIKEVFCSPKMRLPLNNFAES